ncbi:MAG: hypothetical protein U9P00_07580 [Pseudomonadota bacterium]|nr:hypothetical protein [Pseudomonadota bacterium]
MAEATGDIQFRKEMGITRQEFLRNLAGALSGRPYRVEQNEVIVSDAERRVAITLCEQHEQRIGSLKLPRIRVEFSFSGYSKSEAERLMTHIDIHLQRGGG